MTLLESTIPRVVVEKPDISMGEHAVTTKATILAVNFMVGVVFCRRVVNGVMTLMGREAIARELLDRWTKS